MKSFQATTSKDFFSIRAEKIWQVWNFFALLKNRESWKFIPKNFSSNDDWTMVSLHSPSLSLSSFFSLSLLSLSLLHALTRSPHTSAHTNTQLVCLLFEVVFSSNPPPNTSGKPPARHKFSIRKKWHCRGPFYKKSESFLKCQRLLIAIRHCYYTFYQKEWQ